MIVDDGLATGRERSRRHRSRTGARCRPGGRCRPGRAARYGHVHWQQVAEAVISVETPSALFSIGQFYVDFRQTSDEEVVAALGGEQ